ncbi:MAG: hypothetical protein ACXWJ4_11405, partial [Methyloceanibacter sp.]
NVSRLGPVHSGASFVTLTSQWAAKLFVLLMTTFSQAPAFPNAPGLLELREPDDEGGEILVSTIFSYRTASNLSKQEATQDIIRKARHALNRAAGGT